jgi:DNA-binding transcriptional MocR family regulator
VAVGTISRTYVEAEKRGLVTSHVGRGTFVAERQEFILAHRQSDGRINLGMNVPPIGPALCAADRTLEGLRAREDRSAIFDYTFTAGLPALRGAAATWLQRHGGVARADPDHIIQTNGGQHALMLACSAFARHGDTVLCDTATYAGNRTIADHGGWDLRGVPTSGCGMDPQELERAIKQTGARLLVLIPTLQNPTALTMDADRRAEILSIARAHDLLIVEDDIYRVFGNTQEPAPFADLAPERTIHVTSISKALSPGLRLGFILAPENDAIFERLLLAAQATGFCPPAASGLIFAEWTENGLADRILGEVREEMDRRVALAREILGPIMAEPGAKRSLHVWLPMDAERASAVFDRALKGGVDLTPPAAPYVDGAAAAGLRVCLGTPLNIETLERGLRIVKAALEEALLVNSKGII